MANVDIKISNARLRGRGEQLFDVAVHGGRIHAVGPGLADKGQVEIDANGGLVTEAFANAHLHLCKVWTLARMEEAALRNYHEAGMGKALSAIDLASKVKEQYDISWLLPNGRRAVAMAALHGNLHIRAFADVDSKARLEGVKTLLALREEFSGIVDIQVVAFAQDGIVREPGAEALMRQALELGADVVGGIPWIEDTDADALAHVRFCFDLAAEFDKDVSMLLDDAGDPTLRTLEMMASETIRRGWNGRALAHHCRAMSMYPEPYLQRLINLLRKADVAIVSDPHTGPLHARVKELLAEGMTVCLGQDDISDAYYPFGRNNMLEIAFLGAHLLWMTSRRDIERLYEMITTAPAKAMNIVNVGLAPGNAAHLVVLNETDVVEAIRNHAEPRVTISHGKVVDADKMRRLAASAGT
jgi:cytosine deaminase